MGHVNKIILEAHFSILSDDVFDTDIITKTLGISPSKTFQKGDFVTPKATLKNKYSGWVISDITEEDYYMIPNINRLLDILMPKEKEINCLYSTYNLEAQLSCVAYFHKHEPSISFSRDVLSKINRLNADIDIDLILW